MRTHTALPTTHILLELSWANASQQGVRLNTQEGERRRSTLDSITNKELYAHVMSPYLFSFSFLLFAKVISIEQITCKPRLSKF